MSLFDSHAQLLVDAAEQGSGHKKTLIPDEEAEYSYQQVGTPEKGWLVSEIVVAIRRHLRHGLIVLELAGIPTIL